MNLISIFIAGVAVFIALAAGMGAYRFSRQAQALASSLDAAPYPVDVSAHLPQIVREFARRNGAVPSDLAHSVTFEQSVEIQLRAGQPWQQMTAHQVVSIGTTGFLWRARQDLGLWPKFQVMDAFIGGKGLLQVRLLGLLRIVNATGPVLDRDEAMRYLAELPWAPDAILGNPSITWRVVDADWVEASIDVAGEPATVRFRFDANGDVIKAIAPARTTTDEDGNPASYPWQGHFHDYQMAGPRRIPTGAEVGYIRPKGYHAYFRCQITDYSATH